MGGEIIDAILVIDAAVRFADINRAKAVFDNKQWQLVVIPEPVQRIAQADRVNLPAPVRLFDVRVGDQAGGFIIIKQGVVFGGFGSERHIVAKANVVDTALG